MTLPTSPPPPGGAASSAARLRAKLRSGAPVVGAMVGFPAPEIVEMLGHAGYDFVTLDLEHEPMDDSAVTVMIRTADSVGLPAIIRSPMNHRVSTLLNFGAAGIQVPDVDGPEQLKQIVSQLRFPPRGTRFGTLLSRVVGYGTPSAPVLTERDDPVLIAMVENVDVATRIDELIRCDGVDAFHVGPYDLRASMGTPSDDALQAVIGRVVEACAAAGAVVSVGVVSAQAGFGAVVESAKDVAARYERGQRMFVVAVSMLLAQQLSAQRAELAAALGEAP